MTRRMEIEWLYRGLAPQFPEQWQRFRADVPAGDCDGDLVAAYYREAASLSMDAGAEPPATWSDPRFRTARARIVTHYFHHAAWLETASCSGTRAAWPVFPAS